MNGEQMVGVAFYLPEEWEALRKIAPDRDALENTYAEWLEVYNGAVASLRTQGMRLKRVDVRVRELERWCQRQGRHPDASARAEYANDVLRRFSMEGFNFPDA